METDRNPTCVDIHSHVQTGLGGLRILNVDPCESAEFPQGDGGYWSVGIHPCSLGGDDPRQAWSRLENWVRHDGVLALGECGLDRRAVAPWALQEAVFVRQLLLADRLGKPVIVHCVRAHNDLIRIRKSLKISPPFVVHGFDNREEVALSLLRSGCYLSFGRSLLRPHSNAASSIVLCPPERLFLETDASGLSIANIYEKAAELTGLNLRDLQDKLFNNFNKVFGTWSDPTGSVVQNCF